MRYAVTWAERLQEAFAPLLDFVFPPYCVLCESHLQVYEHLVCADCWRRLPTCGQMVLWYRVGAGSLPPAWSLSATLAVWAYNENVERVIHLFKYNGYRCLAHPLGLALGGALFAAEAFSSADVLVPVPLHPVRRRERGYNQSELLARTASRLCGISLLADALRRIRYTTPQAKLGPAERAQNVRGAFAVKDRASVIGKKVVLIDDVFTTGATSNECARMLLEAGAHSVFLATVARA
ncbi:MAG: ComF family protein [Candidatus Oleimicrobiaceae bacterium]